MIRRIALTGNIASGKSTVAEVWRRAGAPIIDADLLAREAVSPGTPALEQITERFGPEVLREDGTLDRDALRHVVFADDDARNALEAILHPAIQRLRVEREARLETDGATLAVHVIPLLFETGLEREFDDIVFVDAPESVRLARLVRERGIAEDEARRMIAAQIPATGKRGRATLVIDNDGTFEALEAKAAGAWQQILHLADES